MSVPPGPHVHTHACDSCTVERSFCPLPPNLRGSFEVLKTSVAYGKGDVLFHETDTCHSVFILCSGSVKLVTSSRCGKVFLLQLCHPGELLGLAEAVDPNVPYGCSAIVAEPSICAVIPRETFVRFAASHPAAAYRLIVTMSEQYNFSQRETRFLGFGDSSETRLARVLLDWSGEHGTAGHTHLPRFVTHNDLAQAIGATRETVTRILSDLHHRGVVSRAGDEIVIDHPEQLARLASH